MRAVQSAFGAALLDPRRAPPLSLTRTGGRPSERRFAVYRNNVAVGLIGALETRFPAIRMIVGEECFTGLARAYALAHPPTSPIMATFGDGFADFLRDAPGLEELDYLPDVARLEAARTRAYHAADAAPVAASDFAALDLRRLEATAVALHPSVEIVRSSAPVVTIWAMNAGEAALGPIEDWAAEDAMVCRPEMVVETRRLPPGGADFLDALGRGATLGAAMRLARRDARFDLAQNLTGLIGSGLAVRLGRPTDRSAA
ncbi:DNA-binding domain-containing protein [Hansschlegelia zhihuaiae]|uniref:DUF2063 domain-containing protein n=1 Tax=Hansschlegelia zhihuaiae TaxID=405005 RepID=A0A4Q0M660_9HYPH|nr:DNA-binding domain-containing protein [Hansschlegelia zhihuaiae]RXF68520.1 DUF2063 domain-containing protein [Hansschlegelia zhihuaiae]